MDLSEWWVKMSYRYGSVEVVGVMSRESFGVLVWVGDMWVIVVVCSCFYLLIN